MNRKQFIAAKKVFNSREQRTMELLSGIVVLVLFCWGWIMDLAQRLCGVVWDPDVSYVLMGAFGLVGMRLVFWLQKRRTRQMGLVCASCDTPLLHYKGEIAIATGVCGDCGDPAFDDLKHRDPLEERTSV